MLLIILFSDILSRSKYICCDPLCHKILFLLQPTLTVVVQVLQTLDLTTPSTGILQFWMHFPVFAEESAFDGFSAQPANTTLRTFYLPLSARTAKLLDFNVIFVSHIRTCGCGLRASLVLNSFPDTLQESVLFL